MNATPDHVLLRWSLAFVWLATAAASVWEINDQSRNLLHDAGVQGETLVNGLILGGAAVDAVLGLALLFAPRRGILIASLWMMGAMTLVATLLAPGLWLHPLGPLTKNVPLAAILLVLYRKTP